MTCKCGDRRPRLNLKLELEFGHRFLQEFLKAEIERTQRTKLRRGQNDEKTNTF
jgi:hypothetical protein